jgi:hypothetical protein
MRWRKIKKKEIFLFMMQLVARRNDPSGYTTLLIYSLLIELKFLKATKIGMVWEAVAALPENSPTSSPLSPTTTMLPAPKNLNLPNLPHHHSDATLVSPPIRAPALS